MEKIYRVVVLAEGEDGKTVEIEEEIKYWSYYPQPPSASEMEALALLRVKEKNPLLKKIRAKTPHGMLESGRRWRW